MFVAEALRNTAMRLEGASDTARLDAELLMAEALGVSRSELLLRHMDDPAPAQMEEMLQRRLQHEPVAYILGKQEFFGREFLVTPDVLIPRADSETTVQAALAACPTPERVLDCGTGSGALLLTILAECPAAKGIGIDRSLGVLALASANAARLGLADRTRMLAGNWREPDWAEGLGRFDLVIANPPYVEADARLAPEVRLFEPAGALFSGKDGLDDYRILIPQLPFLLTENGLAVLEIGAEQAEKVGEIAAESRFTVELHKDLAARPRALVLRLGLGKSESAR